MYISTGMSTAYSQGQRLAGAGAVRDDIKHFTLSLPLQTNASVLLNSRLGSNSNTSGPMGMAMTNGHCLSSSREPQALSDTSHIIQV